MKTGKLIEFLRNNKSDINLWEEVTDEIIKKLEEHEELMKCRVMTVDGKWKESGK